MNQTKTTVQDPMREIRSVEMAMIHSAETTIVEPVQAIHSAETMIVELVQVTRLAETMTLPLAKVILSVVMMIHPKAAMTIHSVKRSAGRPN